ncbi:hypothetical protein CK203_051480 [Vitis vinifera]|uniref:Uncharacterized protein n=1 Tax=Vitis vinifera TaxID=29760 RepID=A0A438GDE1_VITVI|nr:hypothetical protein CK203_051480 [Vitis vinifera]
MATPSQSRSSGREEEDNHEWRQAIEKRQLASEKQLKALLQETERLGKKTLCTHSSLNIRTSSSSALKRPGGKLKARARINISWVTGAIPGTYNARPHEPRTPMPRAPPTRAWEIKATSSHNPAPRPDPMIAPIVQNVPPHRDPMVTLAMRNVHSHLAERPAGRNLPNEPPIAPSAKAG